MPDDEVVMSVRVPVVLRDQLAERARQEERSMAAVLRRAMRAYVKADGVGGDTREVAEALCSGSGDCEYPYCSCPRFPRRNREVAE